MILPVHYPNFSVEDFVTPVTADASLYKELGDQYKKLGTQKMIGGILKGIGSIAGQLGKYNAAQKANLSKQLTFSPVELANTADQQRAVNMMGQFSDKWSGKFKENKSLFTAGKLTMEDQITMQNEKNQIMQYLNGLKASQQEMGKAQNIIIKDKNNDYNKDYFIDAKMHRIVTGENPPEGYLKFNPIDPYGYFSNIDYEGAKKTIKSTTRKGGYDITTQQTVIGEIEDRNSMIKQHMVNNPRVKEGVKQAFEGLDDDNKKIIIEEADKFESNPILFYAQKEFGPLIGATKTTYTKKPSPGKGGMTFQFGSRRSKTGDSQYEYKQNINSVLGATGEGFVIKGKDTIALPGYLIQTSRGEGVPVEYSNKLLKFKPTAVVGTNVEGTTVLPPTTYTEEINRDDYRKNIGKKGYYSEGGKYYKEEKLPRREETVAVPINKIKDEWSSLFPDFYETAKKVNYNFNQVSKDQQKKQQKANDWLTGGGSPPDNNELGPF